MDYTAKENEIQQQLERGNYHAAMNLSISAMNECRREQDQPGVERFLGVMQAILDRMKLEYGGQ